MTMANLIIILQTKRMPDITHRCYNELLLLILLTANNNTNDYDTIFNDNNKI